MRLLWEISGSPKKGLAVSARYGIEVYKPWLWFYSPLVCIARLCFGELHHFFKTLDGRLIGWKGRSIINFGETRGHPKHPISTTPMACTARQQLKRIREFLKIRTARIYVNGKGETRCVWGPVWYKDYSRLVEILTGLVLPSTRKPNLEKIPQYWTDFKVTCSRTPYTNPYQPTRCTSLPAKQLEISRDRDEAGGPDLKTTQCYPGQLGIAVAWLLNDDWRIILLSK